MDLFHVSHSPIAAAVLLCLQCPKSITKMLLFVTFPPKLLWGCSRSSRFPQSYCEDALVPLVRHVSPIALCAPSCPSLLHHSVLSLTLLHFRTILSLRLSDHYWQTFSICQNGKSMLHFPFTWALTLSQWQSQTSLCRDLAYSHTRIHTATTATTAMTTTTTTVTAISPVISTITLTAIAPTTIEIFFISLQHHATYDS